MISFICFFLLFNWYKFNENYDENISDSDDGNFTNRANKSIKQENYFKEINDKMKEKGYNINILRSINTNEGEKIKKIPEKGNNYNIDKNLTEFQNMDISW